MDPQRADPHAGEVTAFAAPPTPPHGLILAEAVTFDPEFMVAVFVVFLVVVLAAFAVVVTGIVAGFRAGRDPGPSRASSAWWFCLVLELAFTVPALLSLDPRWIGLTAGIVALTVLANQLGRWGAGDDPKADAVDTWGRDPWVR